MKAIIIDDSKVLRTELKILLEDYPFLTVVGEASRVDETVQLINNTNPDVIFLDIQLKGETGFEIFERTEVTSQVIFITAYDQYALRAFEVNAIDYLLKPISKNRLSLAIKRLHPNESTIPNPLKKMTYNDVVYLMINRSLKFIKVSSLHCILAEGKYSYIIYSGGKKSLVSKTLHQWEDILPGEYFARIHRSTIVNFEFVEKTRKLKNHTHEVYVAGIAEPLIMSRRYAAKLKKVLSW